MTRGWGKSLLFKIAIVVVLLFALLCCGQSASASDIVIEPSSTIDVRFSFDEPKATAQYKTTRSFTIRNTNPNSTVKGDIIDVKKKGITITPNPSHFDLDFEDPPITIYLTISASSSASQITNEPFVIKVGSEKVTVKVTIIHYAKIEVSPSSIDFGRVSRTDTHSETITLSEEYGYKKVDVQIKLESGNSWVTPSSSNIPDLTDDDEKDIRFTLDPGKPKRNEYSWRYKIIPTTSNTKISPSSIINIEAYISMPPKLGPLPRDKKLEIKFDKPKGTVRRYDRYLDVRVKNEGDEIMHLSSHVSESPGSGISINIDELPKSVSGKKSEDIKVHVTVPYNTPEGTYHGQLAIKATDENGNSAGHGEVDITITIKWPVDFTISSGSPYYTSSPPSIDFGSLELKERGYEKKSANLTLTEYYLYKPVRNLRFSTNGEYGNWLKEEMEFSEIPPGESRNITLYIEPGLEAVPKDYSWKYYIAASEISAKRIDVLANIVPMNTAELLQYLKTFRESDLYSKYPSSEDVISNGVGMLEVIDESKIGAEDWKKIPVLLRGSLSLLSSLNDGILSSDAENYGESVESLLSASVSASTIGANSELSNHDISGYAKGISSGADTTMEAVLTDNAKMLEGRGWYITNKVEHAIAKDNISELKEAENVLESALSYYYAATLYEVLGDEGKRIECMNEKYWMMDWYYKLASDATDLRFEAGKKMWDSRVNDLVRIRIWDTYYLSNPYNYDTFSANYGSAEKSLEEAIKNYKVAGIKEDEPLLVDTKQELNVLIRERNRILFLFFFPCILYGAVFIYMITRIIMGSMAYMRDMHEREVGDVVVA